MNYFIVGFCAGAVLIPGSWLGAISLGLLNVALRIRAVRAAASGSEGEGRG